MRSQLILILGALCYFIGSSSASSCWDDVRGACGKSLGELDLSDEICTAHFGGFPRLIEESQELVSKHLQASMQYLLIASHFKEWKVERKGFNNFFSKLSDGAWDDAVALIKHITKRGGRLRSDFRVEMPQKATYQMAELEALSKALDIEKRIALLSLHLLHKANHGETPHDGEFSHFLAEELSDKTAKRVKEVASHINTLAQALKSSADPSFVLYLYDTQILK